MKLRLHHARDIRSTGLLPLAVALLTALVLCPPASAEEPADGGLSGVKPSAGIAPPTPRLPGASIPATIAPDDDEDGGSDAPDESGSEDATERDDSGSDDGSTGTGSDTSGSSSTPTFAPPRQKAPVLNPSARVQLDFVNKPLMDLIKYMAEVTGRNFILNDEIKGDVTIISHKMVSVPAAYEAFLSALEVSGYTTVQVGSITKVVKSNNAKKTPLRVHQGGNIPFTDNFVTQIIELENVSVSDISSVVKDLMGADASVISYAPANTIILTDAASNIRKIYRIINQLDIAAPKARLHVITLTHAEAGEVQKIIQELYGTEASSSSSSSESSSESRRRRRSRLRDRDKKSTGGSSTSIGVEGKYIEKIIADERTNSLIVMANDEALQAVVDLINELDVDVDPSSRAQIHVYYLKHAKAEDVAQVLSNLSDNRSDSRRRSRGKDSRSSRRTQGSRGSGPSGVSGRSGTFGSTSDQEASAIAAFEDGVRITSDENTNSLVIIATVDQFAILRQVISKLDIRRKQVFVEAVILEIASEDNFGYGLGAHVGMPGDDGSLTMGALGLDGSSLGLSAEALSGLAVGVYGKPVQIEVPDPLNPGGTTTLSVPAFGIALNALQSNASVNIISTPNILTMDNEEAKIVVGRNIPFPQSTGRDNIGQPIVSYTREDVAITLKVTPQINEAKFVTLEVFQEVQEVEEKSTEILDASTAGFITSKRSAETTVVVQDNQTVVIGGLIGSTETEVETKVPVLGDLPLIGALFRGHQSKVRKTNMMIFLTPHVIDGPEDLEEVYRVKWAQRQEYIRRFYGKGRDKAEAQIADLLQFSMNQVDRPSPWRTKVLSPTEQAGFTTIGSETTTPTQLDVREVGSQPEPETPDDEMDPEYFPLPPDGDSTPQDPE